MVFSTHRNTPHPPFSFTQRILSFPQSHRESHGSLTPQLGGKIKDFSRFTVNRWPDHPAFTTATRNLALLEWIPQSTRDAPKIQPTIFLRNFTNKMMSLSLFVTGLISQQSRIMGTGISRLNNVDTTICFHKHWTSKNSLKKLIIVS